MFALAKPYLKITTIKTIVMQAVLGSGEGIWKVANSLAGLDSRNRNRKDIYETDVTSIPEKFVIPKQRWRRERC